MEIEAKRCGFLDDGRPVILFERHKFYSFTRGAFADKAPDLCNKRPGGYGLGGANQYKRLKAAMKLDEQAALKSTSFGLGQIMGFNHAVAGYAKLADFVEAMCQSEDNQLAAMASFIKSVNLAPSIRLRDWTSFARAYNGPDYAINQYDVRLGAAYSKFRSGPLPDLKIREAQILLTYAGFEPGLVDGWLGSRTRIALDAFRNGQGLPLSVGLTDRDLVALRKHIFG